MVFTFRQLRDIVLRHSDEVGSVTTDALVKDYMNHAHQQRCLQHPWPWMLSGRVTFNTEAGRQVYALSHTALRPLYFFNRATNHYLKELPTRRLNNGRWDWNNTPGSAEHFMLWERASVARQPQAASVVTISSSSSADTGATYNVVIKGIDGSGNEVADLITPAGTVPVSGVVSFAEIRGATKAAAWNGTLAMTTDGGATTNLTLMPWEMGRSYPQIFLIENPTAAETIEYRYFKQPEYLINDYDQPNIPGDFAQILVWDTLITLATYNADGGNADTSIWASKANELEQAMYANAMEGNTLGSLPEQVHTTGDWDSDFFLF